MYSLRKNTETCYFGINRVLESYETLKSTLLYLKSIYLGRYAITYIMLNISYKKYNYWVVKKETRNIIILGAHTN